jgi:hypothetical protein
MKFRLPQFLLAAAIAAFFIVPQGAYAAASTQTAHAFLCAPKPASGVAGPRRVVNSASTATPQPAYQLNADGCAVIASGDVGYFLSQGYFYGPNIFTLIQTGILASTTSTTSTITLPANTVIQNVVLAETAGNAITGGVDIGDATSATTFASAVALGANATVVVKDASLTRLQVNGGAPIADQVLVACHTACNSGSINITIIYSYF